MPQIFISHSAKDRDLVQRDIISPLRENGLKTWYSTDNIKTAAEWERQITEGLKKCDWFLVVLSPRSVASDWVRTEVGWALQEKKGNVIPVLIEECDPTELHLMLHSIQYIDFQQDIKKAQQKLLATWGLDTVTRVVNLYESARQAIEAREWKAAIGRLEAVLRLDPEHGEAQAELERAQQIVQQYDSALGAIETRDWKAAIEHLEAVLRLDPEHVEAQAELASARRQDELARKYNAGVTHLAENRWREALKALRQVWDLDRNYRDVAERIAEAYVQLSDQEGYYQVSDEPVEKEESPPIFKTLASKYLTGKRVVIIAAALIAAVIISVAVIVIRQRNKISNITGTHTPGSGMENAATADARGAQPTEADLIKAGDSLFNEKKYAEAETEYRKALERQPDDGVIHLKLGKALFEQGGELDKGDFNHEKYAEAVEQLGKATQLLQNSAEAYFFLGRARLWLGRDAEDKKQANEAKKQFDDAEKQLGKAAGLEDTAEHRHFLGAALTWLKNFDEAKNQFKLALERDPNYTASAEALKALQKISSGTR